MELPRPIVRREAAYLSEKARIEQFYAESGPSNPEAHVKLIMGWGGGRMPPPKPWWLERLLWSAGIRR